MKRKTPTRMPSPITGEPVDGLFPEQGRAVQTTRWSFYVHILAFLLLWWAPSMPGGPALPQEILAARPGLHGRAGTGRWWWRRRESFSRSSFGAQDRR